VENFSYIFDWIGFAGIIKLPLSPSVLIEFKKLVKIGTGGCCLKKWSKMGSFSITHGSI
jgi:hypothetical protein